MPEESGVEAELGEDHTSGPSPAWLETAVEEAGQPIADRLEVTDVSTLTRLRVNSFWKRLIPTPLAVLGAQIRGSARWRLSRARRDEALSWADHIPWPVDDDGARRALARRAVTEASIKEALMMRTWAARRMRIDGIERLRAAKAPDRGVIVVTSRVGSVLSLVAALGADDLPMVVLRLRSPTEQKLRGIDGLRTRALYVSLEDDGHRFVGRRGGYAVIDELLRQGRDCLMMLNEEAEELPSAVQSEMLHPGVPATLAWSTGAPVLPVLMRRVGLRQSVSVGEPLEARDFDSADHMRRRICEEIGAQTHEHAPAVYPRRMGTAAHLRQRTQAERIKRRRRERREKAKRIKRAQARTRAADKAAEKEARRRERRAEKLRRRGMQTAEVDDAIPPNSVSDEPDSVTPARREE